MENSALTIAAVVAIGAVLPGVQDFAADGVPVFTYTGVYHESTEGQTLRV